MLLCLPSVKLLVHLSSDLTGLGDVLGALEDHRLEDDETLCVPAALPDSCEFCGQRLYKAAPNLPVLIVRSNSWMLIVIIH